ncbi:MAG: DUF58 domain-containing protein [Muribaculum sp.]|nr:DUF58 domain-containing protein [Muribaculum sp.]
MRGILLLVTAAATLYIGGMYHAATGLFAGFAEAALFAVMAAAALWLPGQCGGMLLPGGNGLRQGSGLACFLQVENRGRMPVWFWSAQVRWTQGEHKGRRRLSGQVKGGGRERVEFEISAPHCGFVELELRGMWIWDPMRLFRRKAGQNRKRQILRIPVFPPQNPLRVETAQGETAQASGMDQTPLPMVGNDVREVWQYREYQSGDSMKNIHWKLSARSDELWVKEYSKADARRVGLFLDLTERENPDLQRRDAFYEIFLALFLGILEKYDSLYLYWFDWNRKTWAEERVSDAEQYRVILPRLYEAGWIPAEKMDEKTYREEKNAHIGRAVLQLDADLRLSYEGGAALVLKRFSLERYRQEIAEQKVVIP